MRGWVKVHQVNPAAQQSLKHLSRGDSRSIASLGLIMHSFLTECNHSRLWSLKFPFVLILAGTIIALWRWLRNSEWEVLMRTCALLRNRRHQAIITPFSPLQPRLIHISPIYWIIFCSFEIILERKLSIGLEFKVNVLCKSTASKNIQSDMNYI